MTGRLRALYVGCALMGIVSLFGIIGAVIHGGGGGVTGWPTSSTNKEITWANSLANAARIGDGTNPGCVYTDASQGFRIRSCTAGNLRTYIESTFNWALYDVAGAANMLTVLPSAATTRLMYEFGANYRPRFKIPFTANTLVGDGTNCPADPTAVTLNSGPKLFTFICGSGANGDLDGWIVMPSNWDGGTLDVEVNYIQTAVNTAAFNSDIKMQCRGVGETPSSTWGASVAIDDSAVTGSGAEEFTAGASAVTPAGTCAAGDALYLRWTLDVTGTTTPEATLHIKSINVYGKKQYLGN